MKEEDCNFCNFDERIIDFVKKIFTKKKDDD